MADLIMLESHYTNKTVDKVNPAALVRDAVGKNGHSYETDGHSFTREFDFLIAARDSRDHAEAKNTAVEVGPAH